MKISSDQWLQTSTAYVVQMARHVIQTCGDRSAGSDAERQAQELVRAELQSYADGPVDIEDFDVAQKAFMGVPLVVGTLMAATIVASFFSPWLAFAMSGCALLVGVFEMLMFRKFIDPLFRHRQSCNVIGRQQPKGPVKRRIILTGHTDAAYEWRFSYHFPSRASRFVILLIGGVIAAFCASGVVLLDPLLATMGVYVFLVPPSWVYLALVPSALIGILFTNFRVVAPGANDNLTGVFISVAIARHLHDASERLDNTELVVLITGSEEAGIRGAKEFVQQHREELSKLETVVLAIDTMAQLEHMAIANRDLNRLVAHDPTVCHLLREAGREKGLELPSYCIRVGATDAAAFTQAGIPTAALLAMDPSPADFYHTRRDNAEILSEACIEKTIDIVVEAVRRYDRDGLARS